MAMQPSLKMPLDLISTQNMNFKCWPSLLLVMDQRVLLLSGEQKKMVKIIFLLMIQYHRQFYFSCVNHLILH